MIMKVLKIKFVFRLRAILVKDRDGTCTRSSEIYIFFYEVLYSMGLYRHFFLRF